MTLDTLVRRLELAPHPEGGFYRETFRSDAQVPGPAGAPRAAVTQILYALPAGAHSAWHRVRSDELWQHQGGAPVDLYVLHGGRLVQTRLGDVRQGHAPQGVVPAGCWQAAAAVVQEPGWALCGCTVAPGFSFEDFELADAATVDALVHGLDEGSHAQLVRRLGTRV